MASSPLNFDASRASYVIRDGAPPPEDGRSRPVRVRIVGGKPEYGNVAKLPRELWEKFSLAVVDYVPPESHPDTFRVDLAIVLTDLSGTKTKETAKRYADQVIYASASWATISLALKDIGYKPYPQANMTRPPKKKKEPEIIGFVPQPALNPKLEPEPEPESEPRPELEPEPEPEPVLPPEPIPPKIPMPSPEVPMPVASPNPTSVELDPETAEEIDRLRKQLDTPAVRAITGRRVTTASVLDLVIRRGIDALSTSLTNEEE